MQWQLSCESFELIQQQSSNFRGKIPLTLYSLALDNIYKILPHKKLIFNNKCTIVQVRPLILFCTPMTTDLLLVLIKSILFA